ncbi:cytosolic endo-beta-N-acetylglucosaminidase 1-like isoform X1 [Coffea arabica]|uniref:mannosyl-glycoprotein endo-beta-N-acetylglucosaminidase n=1 Tax=Coffea arabica TaxID=13443 RepID=A0A6P6W5R5_COFAR|nr:cytosolic endo-beta-N-acetylglucosaminidase 1-like [Coffea arabica]XP_027110733.1 cytosolic endo-beta-N-acetylglucosaminidase 1-like [Coffea arabica]
MLLRLRAYLTPTLRRFWYRHRHTLSYLKSFLDPLLSIISTIMDSNPVTEDAPQIQSFPNSDPPPFDPKEPAIPISYPLKTLEELQSRSYFDSFHFPFNKSRVKLQQQQSSAAALPQRRRMLVCHDLEGGYADDKWVQGGNNADAYAIWHWYLMDVFVYFSHYLVTLPPPCWTNTAHKHGVKVLGTFIMEWKEGRIIANKLLSTKESAQMYAELLTELAVALGFDGWLINMEVELDVGQIPNLKEFVSHLTQTMHSSLPTSLVIWYDSVTINGDLDWQNQLNDMNKPFFDLCDGIFVNYTWKETYPKESASVAGDRRFDVYMGIDVFGRNTYGGGEWTTNVALDVIKNDDVSAAIFAPGWVYETKQPPDFQTAQNRWWGLVEQSWGISLKYPQALPFYSNFDQGHGHHKSVDGAQISGTPWNNISSQSFQPFLKFSGDSASDTIQVSVDFKEASYSGGGNITFKGTLDGDAYFKARLFQGELILGDLPVHFTYSVKSNDSSLLGLLLEFSSAMKDKISILLASWRNTLLTMNRFSSQFSSVIMPRRVTNAEAAPEWIVQESSIAMGGYTLTEIHAVCYMATPLVTGSQLEPDDPNSSLALSQSEYSAVLGHLNVHMPSQNSDFPPSASWTVGGEYIKWSSGSEGSKEFSVKLIWQLKDGKDSAFPMFNIYVQKLVDPKLTDKMLAEVAEFLGVAEVEAFYISDLILPSATSSLKFIIQVCNFDGASQKLEDSPFLDLQVDLQVPGMAANEPSRVEF